MAYHPGAEGLEKLCLLSPLSQSWFILMTNAQQIYWILFSPLTCLNNNLNGKRSSHDLSQRPCVPASFRQLFVFLPPTLRACRRQKQKTRWFSFSFILERKGVFECLPKTGIDNKSTCVFLLLRFSLERFLFSLNLVNELRWIVL